MRLRGRDEIEGGGLRLRGEEENEGEGGRGD